MLVPETREQIEKRALEIAAYFDEKDGKRVAEIVPGVTAKWHMANTKPGNEDKVADQLAERGIGAFVPRFDTGSVISIRVALPMGRWRNEELKVGNKLIFPCRVFIFVWDVMEHWRRVRSCPDLQSIIVDGAQVPVALPDEQISRIQALQFELIPKEKKQKKRKRYQTAEVDDFVRTMHTKDFMAVDGAQRNQALDRSLGLAL